MRTELIRAWAAGVSSTTDRPIAVEEIDIFLRHLLDRLIDALSQAEFRPQPAVEIGRRLVARGFTGEQSLGRTMEILGHGLPRQPDLLTGLPNRNYLLIHLDALREHASLSTTLLLCKIDVDCFAVPPSPQPSTPCCPSRSISAAAG